MNHRSTLVEKVLEYLTSGLQGVAQIGLIKHTLPYPDLTQVAQLCVTLVSERQASELQTTGAASGVTYGPTSNKNLSPNPLDRRVLKLQLDIEAEDADSIALLARLDGVIDSAEALMQADGVPVPWQHFVAQNAQFAFTKQADAMIGKVTLIWEFFYQVEPPEEAPGPTITDVYLGPQGGEHHHVATVNAQGEVVIAEADNAG
ncbi:hypothetical protein PSECIP111854_02070 [Pseudoalteromonas sp. CIP111854]|uniref:Uncharacterized protein n=1 Tax=Pseudoalteromonas holothuriae TaxID=2963714 RepID=A0A9W4VZC3_9GAMM|nr:hypothetical protein [Pseudoalteromonas sp. CIP111854]CAH9057798.1 hypothetical protein PSECIP111854_02070 [Pseudoalteromonas sp. CIP111854]